MKVDKIVVFFVFVYLGIFYFHFSFFCNIFVIFHREQFMSADQKFSGQVNNKTLKDF